jgi:hypothetical protein
LLIASWLLPFAGAERDRLGKDALQLSSEGRPTEALAKAKQMLQIERTILGDNHVETAASWDFIGAQLMKLERFDEAEEAGRQLLAIRTKLYGADDWRVTEARAAVE